MSDVRIERKVLFVILPIVILLALPFLKGLGDDHTRRARQERRTLAELQPLAQMAITPQNYFSSAGKYFEDHVGFFKEMKNLMGYGKFHLFGGSISTRVSVGKDGYLFLNSFIKGKKDLRLRQACVRVLEKKRAVRIGKTMDEINRYYSGLGIRVAFVIVPSKPMLNAEKLPDDVFPPIKRACLRAAKGDNAFTSIVTLAKKNGVLLHYPFDEFYKFRNDTAFFPASNFHFNGKSAHIMARGLLQKLGVTIQSNFDLKPKRQTVHSDLSAQLGFSHKIPIYKYSYGSFGGQTYRRQPKSVKQYYKKAFDFRRIITKKPMSNKTAVMLTDSFGAYAVEHIAPGYREVIQINTNHIGKDPAVLKKFFTEFVPSLKMDDLILLHHDATAITGRWKHISKNL